MPVSIYDNCLIPDYDSLPEESSRDAVSIRVKKTTILILELYRPSPLGFEIRESEDKDFFWELPENYWYIAPHRPTAVNLSDSIHLTRISDSSQLVNYMRGLYGDIFAKHCYKVAEKVVMPCPLSVKWNMMELKSRPAVYAGDNLYFWCFTKNNKFNSPWPLLHVRKSGERFSRICGNMLPVPWYVPSSFVTPWPLCTLDKSNISLARDAARAHPWLPQ